MLRSSNRSSHFEARECAAAAVAGLCVLAGPPAADGDEKRALGTATSEESGGGGAASSQAPKVSAAADLLQWAVRKSRGRPRPRPKPGGEPESIRGEGGAEEHGEAHAAVAAHGAEPPRLALARQVIAGDTRLVAIGEACLLGLGRGK